MDKNSLAFGTFDGVHIGHKKVLNAVNMSGLKPYAITFSIPPKAIISGDNCRLITTPEQKKQIILSMGITPITLDFESIRNMLAVDFLKVINEKYSPLIISCGHDFRFGNGANGNIDVLKKFCDKNEIDLKIVDAVEIDGERVSSTGIRSFIENGEPQKAAAYLGRQFSYSAIVIHGAERGRRLDFPTINQKYPNGIVIPKFGVYATKTSIDGKLYNSVTNIGHRPTFESDYIISETFIFDFTGDMYGKNATVSLVKFLRPEIKFSGEDNLKNAVENDKLTALEFLKKQ